MNPLPIPALDLKHQEVHAIQVYRHVVRWWLPALSHIQRAALLYILDRTWGWGKTSEMIPLRHFVNGVKAHGGNCVSPGCGNAKADNINRALIDLAEAGAIAVGRDGHAYTYSLNLDWNPNTMAQLKESKKALEAARKAKEAQDAGEDLPPKQGDPLPPKQGENLPLNRGNIIREKGKGGEGKGGDTGATGPGTRKPFKQVGKETLEGLREKSAVKAEARATRHSLSGLDLLRLWNDNVPVPVSTTHKDAAIIRRYQTRFHGVNPRTPFPAFMVWCVRHWPLIRDDRFAWMWKSPAPPEPHLGFFVAHGSSFELAWAHKEEVERMATLSPTKRAEIRLVKSGMAPELAKAEADKMNELNRTIGTLEKRTAENLRSARALSIQDDLREQRRQALARDLKAVGARHLPNDLPEWTEEDDLRAP